MLINYAITFNFVALHNEFIIPYDVIEIILSCIRLNKYNICVCVAYLLFAHSFIALLKPLNRSYKVCGVSTFIS